MNPIKMMAVVAVLLKCSLSFAGDSGYVVTNYAGTVGKYPVHVSLQTYTFGAHVSIKGSYYYDKFRAPIALYGRETAEGIRLCEVTRKTDFEKYLSIGEAFSLDTCPFNLVTRELGLTGIWRNEKSRLDVRLTRTASLDKTHITASEQSIEIPFWGQTPTHSFIGLYENSANTVSANQIKVLDKKTGQVTQVINPQTENCDFGFYMTAIYENIDAVNDSTVSFNCYSTRGDISHEYTFNKKEGKFIQIQS